MRARAVWREATQNVWRGRLATWMQVLAIGSGLAAVFVAEWTSAADGSQRSASLRTDGYDVLAVFGAEDGNSTVERISREHCERLVHSSGVTAAGSVGALTPTSIRQAPNAVVHESGATAGIFAVLDTIDPAWWDGSSSRNGSVFDRLLMSPSHMDANGLAMGASIALRSDVIVDLGNDVAGRGGARARASDSMSAGDALITERALAKHDVSVVSAAPLEALGRGYRSAMLRLVPPVGSAESCLIALEGELLNGYTAPIATMLADETLTYRRVVLGAERLQTGDDLYRERPWRHLWIVVAAVAWALRALVLWTRRSELALYRSLGARRSEVQSIAAAEFVLVMGWSVLISLGIAAVTVATVDPGQYVWAPALPSLLAAICASLVAGLLAAVAVPTARPIDAMKDR